MGLSAAEIAERSGCPPERIQELEDLGILVRRDEDGPFDAKDVHRVLLMQAFEDAGIDLDVIARGIAAGKLSYETSASFCQSRQGCRIPPRSSPSWPDALPS